MKRRFIKKTKKPSKSKYQLKLARRRKEAVLEAGKELKPATSAKPEPRPTSRGAFRRVSGNMRKVSGGGVRDVTRKYTRAQNRKYMLEVLQRLSDANHIEFHSLDEENLRVKIIRPGTPRTAFMRTGSGKWELYGHEAGQVVTGRGIHTLLETLGVVTLKKNGSLGQMMGDLGC